MLGIWGAIATVCMFVENKSVVLDACESERNAPVSGFCVEEEWVSDSHEEEGARLGG